MSFFLTNKFLSGARGLTFEDTNHVTWALNANTNQITASVSTGAGGVTSVGLSDGSTAPIYTITGAPVTTTGVLTYTLKTQSANAVFAGPATGSAAQPGFRSLVAADIPALGANPGSSVGLVAVDGSAATYMRSDGAPALSQAISPVWTGNHTFQPASGAGITVDAVNNSFGMEIAGGATTGESYGLIIVAGSNASDIALQVSNKATTANFMLMFGDGRGSLGASATLGLKWDTGGNITCSGKFAINAGTPTAALGGFGSPSGVVTSGLTSSATLAQTAGTLAALLAYLKAIGFIAV